MSVCRDCHQPKVGEYDFDHVCRVRDLPTPLVKQGSYSIRETDASGRGLWKQYKEHGVQVAYFVGATYGADKNALAVAIEAAEEEMASMLAEFRA